MLIDLIPSAPFASAEAALVRSSGEVTAYDELAMLAGRGEEQLRAAGVERQTAVVVAARSPWCFVVAALAAWRLGAVVAPCDPRSPPNTVAAFARRVSSAAIVTDVSPDGVMTFERAPDLARVLDPRAGLLLATSGTSASPKTVVLPVSGISANVAAILGYLPISRAKRTAVVLPLSYGYGLVGQVLSTLAAGGTLLLLGDLPYATAQVDAMRRLGAVGISSVPSSLRALARSALDDEGPMPLRYVASAGASLDASTRTLLREAFPGATLFNQYGLTEASPRVAAMSDEPSRVETFERGSVGRPIDGVEVFAVDAADAELPVGVEGELVVRGPNVMLGYLDDEAATERALRRDGTLRSGDRGHVDEHGYIFVAGRLDGVVKVSGERVSLEEIAAVLRDAPGIRDAAVVAVPHAELGTQLHAFVEGGEVSISAVREHLRSFLSPAKRPASLRLLPVLPRTASGKVALGELMELAASGA